MFNDDEKKKEQNHSVGQNIDALSVDELEDRISLVNEELKRLQDALVSKKAFLSSAESLFKK